MFITYPKIHRLGKEEVDGILESGSVILQEKIDGANTSVWFEDGKLHAGSRTRELGDESFNGFVEYINKHEGVAKLLADNPGYRLYGEWLVRHTIAYNELAYRKFYLYDILLSDGTWLDPLEVGDLAEHYGIDHPQVFEVGEMTVEKIMAYVGKTNLGEKGEGVVIKPQNFINQFGNRVYAKVVTEKFKEDNALTFGGNNKHSDSYWEMYVVNKYCTLARVQKIMNKVQPEINEKLDKQHTTRIVMTAYHDLITEEAWEIVNKVHSLDFKKLKGLAGKKFVKIYHDILDDHISVAYERDGMFFEPTGTVVIGNEKILSLSGVQNETDNV